MLQFKRTLENGTIFFFFLFIYFFDSILIQISERETTENGF